MKDFGSISHPSLSEEVVKGPSKITAFDAATLQTPHNRTSSLKYGHLYVQHRDPFNVAIGPLYTHVVNANTFVSKPFIIGLDLTLLIVTGILHQIAIVVGKNPSRPIARR
jgi:hypothetical protein